MLLRDIEFWEKALEGFEEDDFNAEIARCIIRIVPTKKSEAVGDRLVKFLGQFLGHASEKGLWTVHRIKGDAF